MRPRQFGGWLHVYTLHDSRGRSGGVQQVAQRQLSMLLKAGRQASAVAIRLESTEVPPATSLMRGWVLPGAGLKAILAPGLPLTMASMFRSRPFVHLHLCRDAFTVPVGYLCVLLRLRFVVQPHGMLARSPRRAYRIVDRVIIRPLMSRASVVIALTDEEARQLADDFSIRDVVTIRNAISVSDLRARRPLISEPVRIVSLGRLHPRKRPDLAVRVLAELSERGVDATLDFVGPDEGCQEALLDLSKLLGVVDRVTYRGGVSHDDALGWLASMHVFLFTAESEPWGLVLGEAASVGLPIVSVPGQPFAEALAERGAALVAEGDDPAVLADLVLQISEENAWVAMHACGAVAVESLAGVKCMERQLQDVYGLVECA